MKKIKFFISDIDGVLTDGGMYYSEAGDELKKFNTKDGMGVAILRSLGVEVVFVTSENTKINIRRANKLKVKYLFQNVKDKLTYIRKFLETQKVSFDEIAYIGDDINDIELLKSVQLSFCPADAVYEVKNNVNYILDKRGGEGVFREAVEFLMRNNYV